MTGEPVDGKGEAQGRYKLMLMSIDHPDIFGLDSMLPKVMITLYQKIKFIVINTFAKQETINI